MSAPSRAARNRANAQSSTGPRTPQGKARVAQNARRHGATGRPNAAQVATWLRVILDAPDLAARDLLDATERERCALALAEAEVRLLLAEQALSKFEAGEAPERAAIAASQQEMAALLGSIAEDGFQGDRREAGLALLEEMGQAQRRQIRREQDRGPLLRRYHSEARARRKRCFRDWIGVLQAARLQGCGTDPEFRDFPKQSQMQP